MKIKITFIFSLVAMLAFAQQQESVDDKSKRYAKIVQSGTKEQKDNLVTELFTTAKTSKNERELETVANYLYRLGKEESADSLRNVLVKKFPKGKIARDSYITNVYYKQENVKDKEKSYKHIVKTWPKEKFDTIKIAYDYVIADLARGFANEGNKEKALYYLGQMNERFWRSQGYIPVATTLLNQGDTISALPLIQTAIDDAEYYISLPKEEKDNRAGFASVGYPGYVAQLVGVYNAQGKHKESLALIEKAIQLAPEQAERFSGSYYQGLEAAGRKLEALQQLEILYKQANFSYKDKIKELYEALNGSGLGFDHYIQRLDHEVTKSIREHIAQNEVYKDAPDFELLNLKGEKVSLASLRGKVVVLDFWATWCQPCIRSFPGMKAAQEAYAHDDDVQFLFINTWERDAAYKANVATFIERNRYPFEVLFDDQKDAETGQNLAARFGVRGIPAKFVLDKEGKIRYALTGSKPDVDYIKLEMSELIEFAKMPHKDAK